MIGIAVTSVRETYPPDAAACWRGRDGRTRGIESLSTILRAARTDAELDAAITTDRGDAVTR